MYTAQRTSQFGMWTDKLTNTIIPRAPLHHVKITSPCYIDPTCHEHGHMAIQLCCTSSNTKGLWNW